MGHLASTSCASGPAFEGAHIRDGMRAATGAIEARRHVRRRPPARDPDHRRRARRWASAARGSWTPSPSCTAPGASTTAAASRRGAPGVIARRARPRGVLASAETSGIGRDGRDHPGRRQRDPARQGRHRGRHLDPARRDRTPRPSRWTRSSSPAPSGRSSTSTAPSTSACCRGSPTRPTSRSATRPGPAPRRRSCLAARAGPRPRHRPRGAATWSSRPIPGSSPGSPGRCYFPRNPARGS